jgi:hypothetical protein
MCYIPLVYVLSGAVTTHKADGLDGRVVAYAIDRGCSAMHNVQDTGGKACPLAKLGNHHSSSRITLRWLHNERVASYSCQRDCLETKGDQVGENDLGRQRQTHSGIIAGKLNGAMLQ